MLVIDSVGCELESSSACLVASFLPLFVRAEEAFGDSIESVWGCHRVFLRGFDGGTVVPNKDTDMHFAMDALEQGLDGGETLGVGGVAIVCTTTPVQVLHDLRDDVGPELVGLVGGLDVFYHHDASRLDAGEPEK